MKCKYCGGETKLKTNRYGTLAYYKCDECNISSEARESKEEAESAWAAAFGDVTKEEACFACKGDLFWVSEYGAIICANCHPPINDMVAVDYIKAKRGA